ncbi:cupin-like domain-containing protein [Mucilaginibacter aquaedulcis]|jgi:histone arginine demethylase JMJD6|uniref:cupin-like domain-containing protein n=1 Tax=Mucilaginibacter aquaedulcis TaxID=1187081 RepID=UPI0025B32620|nr:cupin-like domain-containing protein [Mucilaginibacter aquaedulcis]MDN3551345.1 cupin-like domain-containing protein [Mucilaginibacter aquaedulcis]
MEQNYIKAKAGSGKITTIDKRSGLSKKELYSEYVDRSLPVILTDAIDNWPALGKYTPAFFKENYGHINKTINGVTYNMSDFIDQMLVSTSENQAVYPFNFDVKKVFPELMADFTPEVIYGKMDRINHRLMPQTILRGTTVYELFLGGNGSSFPYLHYDALYMHTQISQLYGSKDFLMYPPECTPNMYPYPNMTKFSQVNFLDPDYEKFPLFKEVEPITVTVEQGETILFPAGWWHTTKINEPCISLGRAQLNGWNWDNFINDRYDNWKKKISVLASPILVYGKVVGGIMNAQEQKLN